MPDPTTHRQAAITAAEGAERDLDEALCSTGDTMLVALAECEHPPTTEFEKQLFRLARRAAFLRVIVRRNSMRSDNAL